MPPLEKTRLVYTPGPVWEGRRLHKGLLSNSQRIKSKYASKERIFHCSQCFSCLDM